MQSVKYNRFICSVQGCTAAYNKQWKLDAHLCKHTGVRPHTCDHPDCGKSFVSPYHLSRHALIHSGDKPFPCTEEGCGEAFTTNSNRARHIERMHRDTSKASLYVCDITHCGRAFRKHQQLRSHMCEEHATVPAYQCTFEGCSMRFTFPSKLKRHQKVHLGYRCPATGCEFVGQTWTELTAHRRDNHRTRFSCDQCDKTFKDQYTMRLHQRIHSDTRLVLRCPRASCTRTFTTAFNLQSHIRSYHEELRPYVCEHPGCGRSFAMKQSLTRHGVVHDPERKTVRPARVAANKRSLVSRLSGYRDPKTPLSPETPDTPETSETPGTPGASLTSGVQLYLSLNPGTDPVQRYLQSLSKSETTATPGEGPQHQGEEPHLPGSSSDVVDGRSLKSESLDGEDSDSDDPHGMDSDQSLTGASVCSPGTDFVFDPNKVKQEPSPDPVQPQSPSPGPGWSPESLKPQYLHDAFNDPKEELCDSPSPGSSPDSSPGSSPGPGPVQSPQELMSILEDSTLQKENHEHVLSTTIKA